MNVWSVLRRQFYRINTMNTRTQFLFADCSFRLNREKKGKKNRDYIFFRVYSFLSSVFIECRTLIVMLCLESIDRSLTVKNMNLFMSKSLLVTQSIHALPFSNTFYRWQQYHISAEYMYCIYYCWHRGVILYWSYTVWCVAVKLNRKFRCHVRMEFSFGV